jgi:ABC-type lipoprotein export system ATPase subunit
MNNIMETQKYPQGAIWRKWDLHIHSKYSLENRAKLDVSTIFEKAINNGMSVISITDHSNFDSLDEIWNVWENGKVVFSGTEQRINELIDFFPGIELKANTGKRGVHLIAIFPRMINKKKANKEFLISEFLSKIDCSKNDIEIAGNTDYSKGLFEISVDIEKTCNKVHELGGVVIVHAGYDKDHSIEKEIAHHSENANDEEILNSLGPHKEKLMRNFIDICELSKESKKSIDFYLEKFNKPTVVFSDSHEDYKGEKFTWIKADPTMDGLKQVINEPDRVFIGDKPQIISKINLHKTKFINKIKINPVKGYAQKHGKWFEDVEIELNKELVGIIGNKGSGKSALADIIALCSFYKDDKNFSFLVPKKFRDKNLAQNFESTIIWEDGTPNTVNLNNSFKTEEGVLERVKYLPQGYFEDLCNEFESLNKFKHELENVVFQHLPDDEKFNKNTFEDLIEFRKRTVEKEISIIQTDISELNKVIISYEKKENKKYSDEIKVKIAQKEAELKALQEPAKVEDPNKNPEIAILNKALLEKIQLIKKEIDDISNNIEKTKQEKTDLVNEVADLNNIKDDITIVLNELKSIKEKHKSQLDEKYKINIDEIIKVEANFSSIDKLIKKNEKSIDEKKILLGEKILKFDEFDEKSENNTLIVKYEEKKKELEVEQNKLDEPQKKYQKYLEDYQIFEKQKKDIIGDENKFDSKTWLEKEKNFIENGLQQKITELHIQRLNLVEQIFLKKSAILNIYHTAKSSIDEIIEGNRSLLKGYEINIDASLSLVYSFEKSFFDYINQGVRGSFYGTSDGSFVLKKILETKNIESKEDILLFLTEIIDHLKSDKRPNSNNEKVFIGTQIADLDDFYNFLFSLDYIDYNYELKLGDKKLESLSPGEKGALLLVFYLLLDKSDIPLILDQPEDNLDNNSVANILVPFIKEAKKKRQIIMVTHNPNLAVVADAEQIIYVNIDKNDGNKFSFTSGSIEDKIINKCIVNVLEGTMPAFNQRKRKYYE